MNNKTISWTSEELFYKIFCKKKCPVCSQALKHHLEKKYIGLVCGWESAIKRPTDQYYDRYWCENCQHDYSIGELAKIRKKNKR